MRSRIIRLFVTVLSASLFAFSLHGAHGDEAEIYRILTPAVSVQCSSVAELTDAISEGLGGIGYPVDVENARMIIAEAALLPDVDCVDKSKPVYLYFLTREDDDSSPECAVILPLSRTGKSELIESMISKYSVVNGKSIRVCKEPVDDSVPDVVYFAAVDGNALISTTLNGVRWLAVNLRDKTLPVFSLQSGAPVEIVVNGPLAGRLLRQFAASYTNDASQAVSMSNVSVNTRELASLVETFSSVSFALKSNFDTTSISIQLDSPRYSDFDVALRKLNPPDEKLAAVIPSYADNLSVSSLTGFLALLPSDTRRWLSLLSLDTWFSGLAVFPASPDLDNQVFPFISGESVSMFLADKSTVKLGNISFYKLADAEKCTDALKQYFAQNGLHAKNTFIKFLGVRNVKSIPVYQYDVDFANQPAGVPGRGGDTISAAAAMTRVETAVWNGKLVVSFGRRGLIDFWIEGGQYQASSHAFAFRPHFKETSGTDSVFLGGGSVKPVETFSRIFSYVDGLRFLTGRLPHPGNGFYWSLSRRGSSAVIEFVFSNNEILACRSLGDVKSEVMRGILSNFLFNPADNRSSSLFDRKFKPVNTVEPGSANGNEK